MQAICFAQRYIYRNLGEVIYRICMKFQSQFHRAQSDVDATSACGYADRP